MPKPLRATFAGAVSRSSPNIPAARADGPAAAPPSAPFPAPKAPTPFPAPKAPTPFPAPKKGPVVTTMVSETPAPHADAPLAADAVKVEDHTKPKSALETDLASTLVSEEPHAGQEPTRPSEPVVEVATVGKSTSMGLGGTMMMDPVPTTSEAAAARSGAEAISKAKSVDPSAKAPLASPPLGLGGTLMLDEPGFDDAGPTQRDLSGPEMSSPSGSSSELENATTTERSRGDEATEPEAAGPRAATPSEPEPAEQPSDEAAAARDVSSPEFADLDAGAKQDAAATPARAATPRSSGLLWVAVTALLVGTGIYFWMRSQDAPETAPLPPEPESSTNDARGSKKPDSEKTAKPSATVEPTAEPTAAPSAAATAAPSAAATADPSAAAVTPPPADDGDAASLPSNKGYLTVNSGTSAQVTLSGALVGATNQRLEVRCGTAFVRLANPGKAGTPMNWLTTGKPVVVECQKATSISIEPGK